MATDSQKRARDKYNRETAKAVTIRFYPAEFDLFDHLQSQDNKAGYIKSLIRDDMEKSPE